MEKTTGNFGKILRELRKSGNMTQESFSKILETDRSNIANYETGKRLPPLDSLIKIAHFFNVSLDYLVFGHKENIPFDDSTDQFNRELMAENTMLMEAQVKYQEEQLKLQEEVLKKDDTIKMQKEIISVLKKYNNMLESKIKK